MNPRPSASEAPDPRLTPSASELPEVSPPPIPIETQLDSLRAEWRLLGRAATSLVEEGRPVSPQTRSAVFEGELPRLQELGFVLTIESDGGPNGIQIFRSDDPEEFVPGTNLMPGEHPPSPLSVAAWDSSEEIEYEESLGHGLFFP
ncbi:hypothetical protein ACSSS7_001120 [Eimeria intestinalis]